MFDINASSTVSADLSLSSTTDIVYMRQNTLKSKHIHHLAETARTNLCEGSSSVCSPSVTVATLVSEVVRDVPGCRHHIDDSTGPHNGAIQPSNRNAVPNRQCGAKRSDYL
jgi:hypothetical protein